MDIEKAISFIQKQIEWHKSEIDRWYKISHIDKMKYSILKNQETFEVDGHKIFGTIGYKAITEHKRRIREYENIVKCLNYAK